MIAATNARLRVTHTTRETLGRGLLEVFPDNPDDPSAIELFRAHQPSRPFEVVITNLGMPYMDGRAVAQAVK